MMNPLRTFRTALLAMLVPIVSPAVAQEPPVAEHEHAAAADDGPQYQLDIPQPVVTVGQQFNVTLTVTFDANTMVPATLLGGTDLRTWLDGEDSVHVQDEVSGEVEIAKGTVLRREFPIHTGEMWPDGALEGKRRLTVGWAGLPAARAVVRLAPDQQALDVETLDLAKTKVRLITEYGEMVIGFFPDKAPNHVRNFVRLSKEGFYNGTRFHRIIRGFMIQGGDPYTKVGAEGRIGTGGPGYRVDAEVSDIKHTRGIVSMARGPDPNSAGSQFFIMHGAAPTLDGGYSAFGQVEAGLDTLDKIADVPVRPNAAGEPSVPANDVWLYAAIVEPVLK